MDNVLFPVRCFTCNKVIGQYQDTYENMINDGYSPKEIMDSLGIKRECCRGNMLNPIQLPPNIQLDITEDDMFLKPQVVSRDTQVFKLSKDTKTPDQIQESDNADRWLDPSEFGDFIDNIYSAR